ncbi:hypothetical protein CKAH01_16758 [Colletotrichum kahawae]|uniref:Uncharacterized protein n=1 Tax=Colletotrichum kahawae TaxID=34407 RepID=A0AAD9YD90_COLKA|nr:hypothetical protein CKAH01_16758 [Colletotrichum kahawae]
MAHISEDVSFAGTRDSLPKSHQRPTGAAQPLETLFNSAAISDDALLLDACQAEQVERFRNNIRLCQDDAAKYRLCLQTRDDLLSQHSSLQFLIAAFDRVMFAEGEKYCKVLRTAARAVSEWAEAAIKLNRVMLGRHQRVRARLVKLAANPIEQGDLDTLKAWSYKQAYVRQNGCDRYSLPFEELAITDLPQGFGFDKFGLMVGKEYAVASAKDDTHSSHAPEATTEGDILSEFVDEFLAEQSADAAANTSDPEAAAAATQEDPSQSERTLRPRTQPSYREMSIFSTNLARIYSSNLDQLCHRHLKLFAKSVVAPDLKAGNSVGDQYNSNVTSLANPSDPPKTSTPRRRTASLPDINQPIPLLKRPRLSGSHTHWTGSRDTGHQPLHNQIADEAYCKQVLAGLQERLARSKSFLNTHGEEADKLVYSILQNAQQPQTDESCGEVDAIFCTAGEATSRVEWDLQTSQFLQKASSSSNGMVEAV